METEKILKEIDPLIKEFQEKFKDSKTEETQEKYLRKIFKYFWTKFDFNEVELLSELKKYKKGLERLYFDEVYYNTLFLNILLYITKNYDFGTQIDYNPSDLTGIYKPPSILKWKSYHFKELEPEMEKKCKEIVQKLSKVNKGKGISISLASKISDEMFFKHGYYEREHDKKLRKIVSEMGEILKMDFDSTDF